MNFDPFVRRLSIRTKQQTIEQFHPNWAQIQLLQKVNEQYSKGRPIRIIVLKARQLGISTVSEALMFAWVMLHQQTYGLVIAHEIDASEYLLNMTKLYWETFPFKNLYTTKYVSRKELAWEETGSSIRIATAKNMRAGRSRTINAMHGSEIAFWDRPDEMMLGLRQTIPNTAKSMIILESTANGVGNWYYDTWQAATANETDFEPLFFPWWEHPDYTATAANLKRELLSDLDSDERVLKKIGVDDDHLVWRRWAVRNLADANLERFMQEYPSTPEEAFIASGTNVFPIENLKLVYEPKAGVKGFLRRKGNYVEFLPDRSGPLTIFRKPSSDLSWGKYFVGADPTHTTMGDNACAQVINRRTYEQVAVWSGKIDPMTFAEELAKLGAFYNHATISTEIEGPGYATIGRLVEIDYPHIWRNRWADKSPGKISETMGWSTTWKRKEWAIGWLIKLIADRDMTIHDAKTYNEMRTYVTLPNGGYGPADGSGRSYDDCVMAMAIACICASTEGPMTGYEGPLVEGPTDDLPIEAPWEQWEMAR
jgi:hypothetical protein